MKTKIWKNQKPISLDLHFKFRCPNKNCLSFHWISFKESKLKNFKIVCDYCGTIFKTKPVDKIKICYKDNKKAKTDKSSSGSKKMSVDNINACVKLLTGYGFTDSESKDMINHALEKCGSENPTVLVKFILENLSDY
jgi:predicted molibdopterin-dependent oxidoreductase YjgC